MRKTVLSCVALTILTLGFSAQAQWVQLPASGQLAGPLDSGQSQLGDEFFNFPSEMGQRPLPGESPLTGWIEFSFGGPYTDGGDSKVDFTFKYDSAGPTDTWEFEFGQAFLLARNRAFSNPNTADLPNVGTLNLDTGMIEAITVNPIFQNTAIAQVTRNNRIPFAFPPTFPLDLGPINALLPFAQQAGINTDELAILFDPGFIYSDASFFYDSEGNVTGFQFFGKTVVPVGVAALFNPALQFLPIQGPPFGPAPAPPFPIWAFGPTGEFNFAHPFQCLSEEALLSPRGREFCPTEESDPDGTLLPREGFFRPYTALGSKSLAEVPAERQAVSCLPTRHAGGVTATVNGKVYLVGEGEKVSPVSDRMDVYDPATDTWSAGPPIPVPVIGAQGAAVGSKIYVYGGRSELGGEVLDILQVFDTETHSWSAGEPGPIPVANGVAASIGSALYVIGGRTNSNPTGLSYNASTLIYYPAAPPVPAGWEVPEFNAPSFLEGASAVGLGAKIYILGGKKLDPATGTSSVTDEVTLFTAVNNTFTPEPPLPTGVYQAVASLAANRIFLIGGRREIEGPSMGLVQEMVLGTGEWTVNRPLPLPVADAASATLNGEILVLGGRSMASTDRYWGRRTKAVQTLHPGRGWMPCTDVPIFNADNVTDAAAYAAGTGKLSPGSLAVVTGYNFHDGDTVVADLAGPPPTELAGISVMISDNHGFAAAAPVLIVSSDRAYFYVPDTAPAAGYVKIQVEKAGASSPTPVVMRMSEVSPAIFVETYGETREQLFLDRSAALACNPDDGALNWGADPVPQGETVVLRVTGLGTNLAPEDVTATVDGIVASVTGVAPLLPGVFDVSVEVPAGARTASKITVSVEVAGVESNRATIAVGVGAILPPAPDPTNFAVRFFLPCRPPLPPAPSQQPFFPLFPSP